jgi:drug/metabolite transporter (DMT)-like permease
MAWTIVWGVVVLVVTVLGARPLGRALRDRPAWWFWIANALVLVVALALAVFSTLISNDALWGVALGFGFGGLAGLRYGFKDLFRVGRQERRS